MPTEMFKSKSEKTTRILYQFIKVIWEQGTITEKTKEIRTNGPHEERFISKQEVTYRYRLTGRNRECKTTPIWKCGTKSNVWVFR